MKFGKSQLSHFRDRGVRSVREALVGFARGGLVPLKLSNAGQMEIRLVLVRGVGKFSERGGQREIRSRRIFIVERDLAQI